MNSRSTYCDGIRRRDFLRVGAAGLFGASFAPAIELAQLRAAEENRTPKDVSLIILFLRGGMSTIDTFDLKPDAPAEFRGEFRPIATTAPDIRICEHLPHIAAQMDKISLIRSFGHGDSNHGLADHYMLTGYKPGPGFTPTISPNNQRPAHGAVIARKLGPRGSVPPYVCLPQPHPSTGSAYLGPACAPFAISSDPAAVNFSVPDILPPLSLDATRLDRRRQLLAQVDQFQRSVESRANASARSVSLFQHKAFDLMVSPEAKRAFDIQAEPAALRDEYGRHTLGQSCLMARRLVEAGVRCVTIEHTNWDTHDNCFFVLKNELLPALDSGLATLFRDLADRGQLERTLVVATGEFGRTPRINKNSGRDHWGAGFTVVLGGGGLRGGVAAGTSDSRAEKPADNPYGPEDLAATIYRQLGINADEEFITPEGRPVKIVNQGRVIHELV
jgi:uncharacterized protein (DUF1501 family)